MSAKWPLTPLGEVLTERREAPLTDDVTSGKVSVVAKITFNDGKICLRTATSTNTGMILARPGDLIVSGINASKGAIAVYGGENTRPIAATIHYGAYVPDQEQVDVRFLWWLLRSNTFRDLLKEYVPGGIKTELKAKRLLSIPVPLPQIAEQQRILSYIESASSNVERAFDLRSQIDLEIKALQVSLHLSLAGERTVRLNKVLELHEEQMPIYNDQSYPQVGVRGFGQGLFSKSSVEGSQTTYRSYNRLYDGAVVLSQVKGWEGAIAVCPPHLAGWFVSPEYRTFRCLPGQAIPEYMSSIVSLPWFWSRLKDATHGMGGRRERTRPEQFLKIEIPMPTAVQQEKALQIFAHLNGLRPLITQTDLGLEALLPSLLDRAFRGRF